MSELQNTRDFESQLDQLKIITLTDGEVWSARDLMPFAGYKAWQDWSRAINRAINSINASGLDASEHFRGSPKMVTLGSGARREVEDVEITRYGCYILFQNADGSKPEVAAAQQYFAVQTRKQEVGEVTLSDDEIIARALTIATGRVKALESKVQELEPKAAQVDTLRESDGLQLIGDLANQLKVHAQTNFPGLKVKQQDVFDLAGQVGLIIRGNTVRKNQPTAQAIEAGWVKPAEKTYETNNHGTRTNYYARLTHKGAGRLWDAAVNNLKTYGQVLAPKGEVA